jgi:hypothetical protein
MGKESLEKMVGKQVDITPWTYIWRADCEVQEKPEAYFIPRRLERMDKIYRTAYYELSPENLKSLYYAMTDLLSPLLPAPKGKLLTGALWVGGLVDYQVQLQWPADQPVPDPETIEVRDFPTAFGWFGFTVDRVLSNPKISADGRTWTYQSDTTGTMEAAYNVRLPAAPEMVAVFCEQENIPVPNLQIVSADVGVWKPIDIEIEWGFDTRKKRKNFEAKLEPFMAVLGDIVPLAGDAGTTTTDDDWQSQTVGEGRRGVRLSLLYAPDSRIGLDSRVTVWSKNDGFTFRITDLEKEPIYIPEQGVFITKADSGQTGAQFVKELAAKKKQVKSLRQLVREHAEFKSWDDLMQNARLWNCPEGTEVPRFPEVQDPVMQVELSDSRWTDTWRAASAQLQGKHMWGTLAFEVTRVTRDMHLIGLHAEADRVYEHFLKTPGFKSDGDFLDGKGALEGPTSLRHDMGYSHDGTHASTGRALLSMAERYFLTGDKEWLLQNQKRLQAAADWIVRQRTRYMKHVPNRKDLFVAGLMPPQMLGDYVLPSCDWHWYYCANALDLQGVTRLADALAEVDPDAGKKYQRKAAAFRRDLLRIVKREVALSPVRLGWDGKYHCYLPRTAYNRGLTGPELKEPEFPDTDLFAGNLILTEPGAITKADEPWAVETLDVLDELCLEGEPLQKDITARQEKGLPTDDTWFWFCRLILPKASINGNTYLWQDDIPNFLRFWGNAYAATVGADGKLWEHKHGDTYGVCEAPDNGTAGWFMECFRNMLVLEEGPSLWIAKGTPRAWLGQDQKISVKNAPTYFGALAYEIVSDVKNKKITATIQVPERRPLKDIILRLRHPKAARIKSVTVNGQPWTDFNARKETINLAGVSGSVMVEACY